VRRCSLELAQPVVLEVVHFDTESCCDHLTVIRVGHSAQDYLEGQDYSGHDGPAGEEAIRLDWYSDGGVTRSGWAICAAGHAADLTPGWVGHVGSFAEKGPAYPWHVLESAWGFATAALASGLLGLFGALLAAGLVASGKPLAAPATAGGCCRASDAVQRAAIYLLAALGAAGSLVAGTGLVHASTVACSVSAHHCAPLLPLFWAGGLLCTLAVPVLVALVCALSPVASQASPRSEVHVARALLVVDLATAALSAVCLGLTIGTRAFHRLPAVYIFSTLGLVAPGFGVGAACLVLRSAARAHVSATANRREHATRMRLASGMLALHVLLVGAAFVGLPVSAATGYGQEMAAYIVTAVACGVCAAVGLALLVLVTQASSGLASEEMAEMVSANHDALAASQQHVLELEHNMTVMIEQQAQLLAALGQPAALPPPLAEVPPVAEAPPPSVVAVAGEAESGAAALPDEESAEKV